jgi:hypothetical protein
LHTKQRQAQSRREAGFQTADQFDCRRAPSRRAVLRPRPEIRHRMRHTKRSEPHSAVWLEPWASHTMNAEEPVATRVKTSRSVTIAMHAVNESYSDQQWVHSHRRRFQCARRRGQRIWTRRPHRHFALPLREIREYAVLRWKPQGERIRVQLRGEGFAAEALASGLLAKPTATTFEQLGPPFFWISRLTSPATHRQNIPARVSL